MNILKITKDFVDEINRTNSILDKKEVLKKYPQVQKLLSWVYSPYKQFHVTSDNLKKKSDLISSSYFTDIFDLLEALSSRKITGHEAIANCNSFIKTNKEYTEIIYNIIDKDLKCRIGEKIINDVYPGCIPTFDVALANKYEDVKSRVKVDDGTWYSSHKLDGCRCITIIDEKGNIVFYSREGKEFYVLNNLKKEVEKLNLYNIVLDGEICIIDENGKENFQGIMKEIRRKDHTILNPKYLVFDQLNLEDFNNKKSKEIFIERQNNLKKTLQNYKGNNIEQLEQIKIESEEHFAELIKIANDNNWEGLIIRKNIPYEGKRSNNLLKVKKMQDAEYKVIDVEFGPFRIIEDKKETTIETLSAVKIEHKGGIVSVGSGYTLEERKEYYEHPERIIDKIITVQYFEETIDQNGKYSLRFPVFKYNHGDKRNL